MVAPEKVWAVYNCLKTVKGLTLRSYDLLQQLHVAWLRNKAHRAYALALL
jgi:hypothetical protein